VTTRRQLEHPEVASILSRARLARLGVEASAGPHVSPVAFAVAEGRVWLVSSRRSFKVGALRRRPAVALLVQDGRRSVVLAGRAAVISPWGRDDLTALGANFGPVGRALGVYAWRHRDTLAGFGMDILGCATAALPHDRVLIAVTPTRGLVLHGDTVAVRWGRWRGRGQPHRARSASARQRLMDTLPIDQLPSPSQAVLQAPENLALGLSVAGGPVVLPARMIGDLGEVEISADVLRVIGAPARTAAALTADHAETRPSRVAGVMLRGTAERLRSGQGCTVVQLDIDRVSWWAGFDTGTIRIRPATSAAAAA
jgi:hypothetical protein